jgi:hypothetical protein
MWREETTKDKDIEARRWFPIDVDPLKPDDASKSCATDEEKEKAVKAALRAREYLKDTYDFDSAYGDSGNGAYLFARLDDIPIKHDREVVSAMRALIEELNRQDFADGVTFDIKVTNAARVTRLFGTVNKKGESTDDRPHRLSRLIDVPTNLQPISFDRILSLLPDSGFELERKDRADRTFDMPTFLAEHGFGVLKTKDEDACVRYELDHCPFDVEHNHGEAFVTVFKDNGQPAFNCHHNSCNGYGWRDFMHEIGDPDYSGTPFSHNYSVKNGCLSVTRYVSERRVEKGTDKAVWVRGLETRPLCNFDARIRRIITVDKGYEIEKRYVLVGTTHDGKRLPPIEVKADVFASMWWLVNWHHAHKKSGSGVTDDLRAAIEFLSEDDGYKETTVYARLGWLKHGDDWVFLTNGGALGVDGIKPDVRVELRERFALFNLPAINRERIIDDVKEVIDLFCKAPESEAKSIMTYPELAWAFRAPLQELVVITTTNYLQGKTGLFKTAVQATTQSFFGSGFNAHTLPQSFLTTKNRLEKDAHRAKDVYFLIDDYLPRGSKKGKEAYHMEKDTLFAGQANKASRDRLRSDIEDYDGFVPRCALAANGEDIPAGESTRGRIVFRQVKAGHITPRWLTKVQDVAQSGLFSHVMAAYVQWLAGQMSDLKKSGDVATFQTRKTNEYKTALSSAGVHAQTPGALACYCVGFEWFVRFAEGSGAIDAAEAKELREQCDSILVTVGSAQPEYVHESDPVRQFVRGLATVIISGRAHLCDLNNEAPEGDAGFSDTDGPVTLDPTNLGWRRIESKSEFNEDTLLPQGRRVGWITDENELYLIPAAAYAEVAKMFNDQGITMPYEERRIYQMLKNEGYLTITDEKRVTTTVKIKGSSTRILKLKTSQILFGGYVQTEIEEGD